MSKRWMLRPEDVVRDVRERQRPDERGRTEDLVAIQGAPGGGLGFLEYLDGEINTWLLADDAAHEIGTEVYEAAWDAGWHALGAHCRQLVPALDAIAAFSAVGEEPT